MTLPLKSSASLFDGIPATWRCKDGSIGTLRWCWQYLSRDGVAVLGIAARYDYPGGAKEVIPFFQPDGQGGWKQGHPKGKKRPLFGLYTLGRPGPVFVCEGEKDTTTLHELGLPAVTSPGGCQQAHYADWSVLADVPKLILWPDADAPGAKYVGKVAEILLAQGEHEVLRLEPAALGLKDGEGAADWLLQRVQGWDGFSTISREPGDGLDEELLESVAEHAQGMVVEAVVSRSRGNASSSSFKTVCLADVEPEEVAWLWPGYLPVGKLVMLDGDPCAGKSTISLDICARISSGAAFPGESTKRPPGSSLYITAEDGLADTVRPRLDACGADATRVFAMEQGEYPVFPEAADWLRGYIVEQNIALVVIDPIMGFLDSRHDSHKDQESRQILGKLSALADETGATIICIRHLRKSGGSKAMYCGGGSIAFSAAARVALLAGLAPDNSQRRVLSITKCNLAATPESLFYRIVSESAEGAPRIQWEGSAPYTADDLVREEPQGDTASALNEAQEFLAAELTAGQVETQELLRRGKAAGFSQPTLKRAKKALGVKSRHIGQLGEKGQSWVWELPTKEITLTQEDQDAIALGF
jgi:putative DNA primase/helicase